MSGDVRATFADREPDDTDSPLLSLERVVASVTAGEDKGEVRADDGEGTQAAHGESHCAPICFLVSDGAGMEVDGGLGLLFSHGASKSSWENDGSIEVSDLGVKGASSREAEDNSQVNRTITNQFGF